MKKTLTIIAFIASILAIIISVLPISNLSLIPAAVALIIGSLVFYISKQNGRVKKLIPFIFILTFISLALTTYKAIFNKTKITDTQELLDKEAESKEEAIDELESLDLEDIEVENIDF